MNTGCRGFGGAWSSQATTLYIGYVGLGGHHLTNHHIWYRH